MKYLKYTFTFSLTFLIGTVYANAPTPPFGSSLLHSKEETKEEQTWNNSTTYVGFCNCTIFSPIYWPMIDKGLRKEILCKLFLPPGFFISKRTISSHYPCLRGNEFRLDYYPLPNAFDLHYPLVEVSYQRIFYAKSKTPSFYFGLGTGLSSFQIVPLLVSVGKETHYSQNVASIFECQVSLPCLVFLSLANCKITYGIGF